MTGGSQDREGLLTGTRGEMEALPRGAVRRLAVTQVVVGALAITSQIVILALYHQFFNAISQGIWCGSVFIVCGIIGIIAARKATKPWIVSHLILCILTCLFCTCIIGLSALTAVYNYGSLYNYVFQPCHYHPNLFDTAPPYGVNPYPSTAPRGLMTAGPGAPERSNPNEEWEYYDPDRLGHKDYYPSYDTYPGYDTYPSYDTSMYTGSYWLSYYAGGYSCYNGRHVLNVPWVVQFSMSLLMGVLGILSAVLAIIAATLSCVPLCCDPLKKLQKEPQEDDKPVLQFDQAGPLPFKSVPVDLEAGRQISGGVTEA